MCFATLELRNQCTRVHARMRVAPRDRAGLKSNEATAAVLVRENPPPKCEEDIPPVKVRPALWHMSLCQPKRGLRNQNQG